MNTVLVAALMLPFAAAGPTPGSGWSRANDLQVYGAMDMARDLARDQSILCRGRSPASVIANWQARFGAREAAVTNALIARHGTEAVAVTEFRQGDKPSCAADQRKKWTRTHLMLLKTLEVRIAGYGSRG